MSQNNDAITPTEAQVDHGGQLRELDEALSIARQALDLQSPLHSLRSESINNLAAALRARFRQGGQHCDLNEAILLDKQALELRSSPHPLRSESLNNLGVDLWERFIQSGQQSDLNEAISLYRQALELRPPTNPHRPDTLNNLALALLILFWQGNEQNDFDEAISLARQALELLAPSHPNQSDSIDIFAFALWTKVELGGGQKSDLDEAISMHRQALNLRPSPHPLRSTSLNNLANALHTRFEHGFQQTDLDEAISLFRQALELRPSPHPLRSVSLNDLAMALHTRFEDGGQRTDLDETILLHKQALELRISHKLLRSQSLSNLADALARQLELFQQGQSRRDNIKEVVSLSRQALELQLKSSPQSNQSLSRSFYNLAGALMTQFSISGPQTRKNLIDESISLHRQALELLSSTDPLRGRYLTGLANALWVQCHRLGHCQGIDDLDEAISLHRQALELQSPLHRDQSFALNCLAKTLGTRFEHEGDQSDFDEAILLFRQATECPNQSASQRLDIAYTWISHVNRHSTGHISLIDAFDAALQVLPNLAALSFDIKSRQESLLNGTGVLARAASRVAIQAGNVAKAVEFLEAGRAVFWSQFLSLRSPLEHMHDIAPELAVKLQEIATSLELGSHRDAMDNMVDNSTKLVLDQEAARLNRLNAEWSKTIEDVRCLNGFEDFLRPRRLSSLQTAASEGPVVFLVEDQECSNILILTSTNVHAIPLSNLPTRELRKLVRLIKAAASESNIWRSSIGRFSGNTTDLPPAIMETLQNWMNHEEERGIRRVGQIHSDDIFRSVLKTLWNEVVKPVIDILDIKVRFISVANHRIH